VVTFGPDENRELDDKYHRRHVMHLIGLAGRPVHWEGDVPDFLNKTEDAAWPQATTEAVGRCALTGIRAAETSARRVRPACAAACGQDLMGA
jgi:hypothetical protein